MVVCLLLLCVMSFRFIQVSGFYVYLLIHSWFIDRLFKHLFIFIFSPPSPTCIVRYGTVRKPHNVDRRWWRSSNEIEKQIWDLRSSSRNFMSLWGAVRVQWVDGRQCRRLPSNIHSPAPMVKWKCKMWEFQVGTEMYDVQKRKERSRRSQTKKDGKARKWKVN